METTLLLSSSVLAGLIAGLVAIRASERKIQIENVTQERAKWRAKIRELSLAVHQSATTGNNARLGELVLEFSLVLNPLHEEDQAIPELIYQLTNTSEKSNLLLEFRERVALLLKHDWERAKHESFSWFNKNTPDRMTYSDYKKSDYKPSKNTNHSKGYLKFIIPFLGVMIPTGYTFLLATILKEPITPLVKRYNTDFYSLPINEHIIFLSACAFIGILWTPFYLWFKGSEKVFLDRWFNKNN
ncbi:hypothetical protein [Trichlorobacter sp.]|uniref:hypothetical protein n=1 Tax=Trichlorobacter sp. TaxID=2911007 RepID=UPI002A3642EE|nr:hypothetical protein [Trichlorobacter sp.]MDY0384729.1 hypothetical protein [Trichlorobacter sp.]